MNLRKLLMNSARELRRKPSYFVPKLATSLIGSLWIIGVFSSIGDPLAPRPNLRGLYIGLATFPFIFFLGLLSPVVVAEMVKNNHSVIESVKSCVRYTPRLVLTFLLLIIGFTIAIIPFYLGATLFFLYNSKLLLGIGAAISLVSIIVITYGIYFLPVTLIDNSSTESIRKSLEASKNNRNEVTILVLISFLLLGIAALSSGVARFLGIAGFILGRLISASVSTYILIVSPKYYLQKRN